MPEDPQVGELVDDDRLERFRWREHEPPRDHEAAFARGAPPSGSRVAQGQAARRDTERPCVPGDLVLDGGGRPLAKPAAQHLGDVPSVARPVTDDELIALRSTLAHDAG